MNIKELKRIAIEVANKNQIPHQIDINNTIVVFRNTDLLTGYKTDDTGENTPDGFLLIGQHSTITLQGRSKPNKRYLDKIYADGKKDRNENFNYIAPCYVNKAEVRGYHKGKPAFVQNHKFPLIRTIDREWGNDDDYVEYAIVADNFHGNGASLGCLVLPGNMGERGEHWNYNQLTGSWKQAYNWGYAVGVKNHFDVLILERSDFENPSRNALRFGSDGFLVKDLQALLRIKEDGDFGYNTLKALVDFQKKNNCNKYGIFEI